MSDDTQHPSDHIIFGDGLLLNRSDFVGMGKIFPYAGRSNSKEDSLPDGQQHSQKATKQESKLAV